MRKKREKETTQGPQDKSPSVGSVQVAFEDLPGPGTVNPHPDRNIVIRSRVALPIELVFWMGYNIQNIIPTRIQVGSFILTWHARPLDFW